MRHRLLDWLRAGFALVALLAPAAGQAAAGWTFHPVPEANAVALGVLWQHGFDDDAPAECGAARVLAECRLRRARAAAPDVLASGLQVLADASIVFVLVERQHSRRGVAFVAALLDERLPLGDDDLALAQARAALDADDAEFLWPGLVLQSQARRALCAGQPAWRAAAGSAVAIQALTRARIGALLAAPVAATGMVLGAVDAELREALATLPLPGGARSAPPAAVAPPSPVAGTSIEHDRVNAPTVGAAFAVPQGVDLAAFALGVEVARARAQQRFRFRANEGVARTPFVSWSWLHGDPVLLFCRRGVSPKRMLPGERGGVPAAAESAATRRELEALLTDLREVPPTADEVRAAQRGLRMELALAPVGPETLAALAGTAEALPGRLQVLLLAAHRRIDGVALENATPAAVHAALVAALAPAAAYWAELLPRPQASLAWRPR